MTIYNSPADILDWTETLRITRVAFDPTEGIAFTFNRPVPESWKVFTHNPESAGDNFQYTVWVQHGDAAAGFIQMWQGRQWTGAPWQGPSEADASVSNWKGNWAYSSRWGALADWEPRPGDRVSLFVSAGNARGEGGVTSVRERSSIVTLAVPAHDAGVFAFDGPLPPPDPPPPPPPPPPDPTGPTTAQLMAAIMVLSAKVDAYQIENRGAFAQATAVLKKLFPWG